MFREGGATPVNMFTSTLSNQFITREGEAPAEPWRRQLGRSLALPMGLLAGRFIKMLPDGLVPSEASLVG